MKKMTEIRGRAVAFKLYKIDESTWEEIDEGGTFHPLSYVQPIGRPERKPDTEIFGLVAGSEIVVGNRTKALAGSNSGQLSPIIIEPPALIIAQGFEGTIFEGEVANPFTDIPRKLDSQEIVYPNGERVRLSLLKAEENELQKSAFSNEITPIRARFAHSEDRLKDIDVWINAQRMQFLSAIENSDKDTIWQMIADGFNPTAEYSGENFKEIPQLFCKDVKTYKLLESLNAVVAVSSESTETIQAIKAYASGNLGLEVLRYIADQDGSLNSDWDGIDGRLAIHAAVATGDLEAVRAIVSAGADIHLASNDGETALGLALNQESSGIVTYLLSQGASLSAEDYRLLELEGDEVALNHPRDGIRSAEMAMLVRQYEPW